jgi:hypothetical protein
MTAYRPDNYDPQADAWRRRMLLGLVVLAALLGAALGLVGPTQF